MLQTHWNSDKKGENNEKNKYQYKLNSIINYMDIPSKFYFKLMGHEYRFKHNRKKYTSFNLFLSYISSFKKDSFI